MNAIKKIDFSLYTATSYMYGMTYERQKLNFSYMKEVVLCTKKHSFALIAFVVATVFKNTKQKDLFFVFVFGVPSRRLHVGNNS